MRNPWSKKNPLMSLWLSGANAVAGAAREQLSGLGTQTRDRLTQEVESQTHHTADTVRRWADDLSQMVEAAPSGPARALVAQVADRGHQVADTLDQRGFGGLVEDGSVRRSAETDCLCLRFGSQACRLCLCLGFDLSPLSLRFGSLDDAVRLCVCFRLWHIIILTYKYIEGEGDKTNVLCLCLDASDGKGTLLLLDLVAILTVHILR